MIKVLANDGLEPTGVEILQKKGFQVITEKVAQEALIDYINRENIQALLVRSATKVRKDVIDGCPGLKLIGRGGVGMDNIDVEYARSKEVAVVNTPAASSQSVAELVFSHLFTIARFLHDSNRLMPVKGASEFDALKKSYSKGLELKGKTLGILGFGRIGQAAAQIALGLGMRVLPYDPIVKNTNLEIDLFHAGDSFQINFDTVSLEEVFEHADFITLHVPMPADGSPVIGAVEIAKMKKGVILVNTARGGIIDENALLDGLNSGQVGAAGLDVFVGEPQPNEAILHHPRISLTPHIGGSTLEAQARIGSEIAERVIHFFA